MTVLAIVQARYSSTRFPGKIFAEISGETLLSRQIERLMQSTTIDKLIIATSTDKEDDDTAACANESGIDTVRGPLEDVLTRFQLALDNFPAETVIRLTGDCPLTDPELIDVCVNEFHNSETRLDYLSNTLKPTFPDGLDVEVFSSETLQIASKEATLSSQREHVTPFIYSQPDRFKLKNHAQDKDLSSLRWTVDQPEDLVFVRHIYQEL